MDLRTQVTLAIAAIAVALWVVARALRLRHGAGSAMAAIALGGVVWIPEAARDLGLAALVGLLVFAGNEGRGRVRGALLAAALVLLLGLVPGGNIALLLAVLGVVAAVHTGRSARHLIRLRRAAALVPGEPSADVELSGAVVAVGSASPPPGWPAERPAPEAAWWRARVDDHRRATSGRLHIQTERGLALAELADARLRVQSEHRALVHCTAWKELEAAVGALAPEDTVTHLKREPDGSSRGITGVSCEYAWLPAGAEVYVVGRPEWVRAPAEQGGYRDAPLVPLLRGGSVFLSDRSGDQVRREACWILLAWALWGAACAAIAALQFTARL